MVSRGCLKRADVIDASYASREARKPRNSNSSRSMRSVCRWGCGHGEASRAFSNAPCLLLYQGITRTNRYVPALVLCTAGAHPRYTGASSTCAAADGASPQPHYHTQATAQREQLADYLSNQCDACMRRNSVTKKSLVQRNKLYKESQQQNQNPPKPVKEKTYYPDYRALEGREIKNHRFGREVERANERENGLHARRATREKHIIYPRRDVYGLFENASRYIYMYMSTRSSRESPLSYKCAHGKDVPLRMLKCLILVQYFDE
ncbi:unnamed protein product [Trichogramma brassicae]|uniref:Uncharacterized protein n=1 Tax=Trichogramma brassicae TaxID=86971 RepID=A0A6H5I3E6_9HYME|nr:unnamed protein product [Trichogramma brassicae]